MGVWLSRCRWSASSKVEGPGVNAQPEIPAAIMEAETRVLGSPWIQPVLGHAGIQEAVPQSHKNQESNIDMKSLFSG